jgi:hypothetical protein
LLFLAYFCGFIGIPTAFIVDFLLFHVGVGVVVRVADVREKENTYTILMGEM